MTGLGLGSDLHYGRDFGFGYILALYALIPAEVLRDPDKLIPLINNLGFYSIILGPFFSGFRSVWCMGSAPLQSRWRCLLSVLWSWNSRLRVIRS